MKTTPPLSDKARTLQRGRYRHYKGAEYEVLGVALHSETLEELVTYRALKNKEQLWVRPLSMFTEEIPTGSGAGTPRFTFLGSV